MFRTGGSFAAELDGQPDIIGHTAPLSHLDVPVRTDRGIALSIKFSYFGLELAESDVGEKIASGRWTPLENLAAFRAMCRGVQRLHNQQVAHRDLKPSNFLLMADRTVKLTDFGTARALRTGAVPLAAVYDFPPGDLRYTAPEIHACLHDDDPSIALIADFFSLGAILFELFTGTVLGTLLFDQTFMEDLNVAMATVARGKRASMYEQFVQHIADGHPLPGIHTVTTIPKSIRDPLNDLYKSLAALDFRQRLSDFDRIFLQINRCILILENDDKYHRWREWRRRLRPNRTR